MKHEERNGLHIFTERTSHNGHVTVRVREDDGNIRYQRTFIGHTTAEIKAEIDDFFDDVKNGKA